LWRAPHEGLFDSIENIQHILYAVPVMKRTFLLASVIVGVASGTLPAMQASKMQPVDALRSK